LKRKVVYYRSVGSKVEPVRDWLRDLDLATRERIDIRIVRAENGNLGDHRWLGNGVCELRFHFGSGYRLYFAFDGAEIILLLVGGDKSSQVNDIKKAIEYWTRYQKDKYA